MVRVVEAVGVGEMGALHAQLLGLVVHSGGKVFLAARHSFRQGVAGVAAGGQQIAVQQLFNSEHLAGLELRVGAAQREIHRLQSRS